MNTYYNDISYTDLFEEVLFLRNKVSQLEATNCSLQTLLNETQLLKLQLENALLHQVKQEENNQSKIKRIYNKKEVSKEVQGMNAFYVENKNNEEIIKIVKTKMCEVGYVINGKNQIPIQLIKMECLKRYNELSESEQERYRTQAR
jgi:ABC-type uncharacterized transport system permease subunit